MNQNEVTEIILGHFAPFYSKASGCEARKEERVTIEWRKINLSIEHSVPLVIFNHRLCCDSLLVGYYAILIERTYRRFVFKNVIDVCVSNQGATFRVLQGIALIRVC